MLAITYRTSDAFMYSLEMSREKKQKQKSRVRLAPWLSSPRLFLLLRIYMCLINVCISHVRIRREELTLGERILPLANDMWGSKEFNSMSNGLIACWQTWMVVSVSVDYLCMEMWLSGQSPRKTQTCDVFFNSGIVTSWVKWFTHQEKRHLSVCKRASVRLKHWTGVSLLHTALILVLQVLF